jgi:hypothetical protein
VQDNIINVSLAERAQIIFTPPPLSCADVSVGPLPAGTYTVNLFTVVTRSANPPPPLLVATKTLVVTPDAAPVPTISHVGIAALTFLLSAITLLMFRRGA